jgi:hypothetical protein
LTVSALLSKPLALVLGLELPAEVVVAEHGVLVLGV